MKLLLKMFGSTLLIALCAAVLVFSGSFLWSAIPRQREEPMVLSTEAFLQEEAEAAPPAELIAPTEETAEAAPPETPKTVVTKVVSNTVEKPRFYIARRHADEPFIHCLTEGKTITNLGMSVEFEPLYIGQGQKTNVEYRAFFIDEANEIISDVKPIVLCSGERCKVTFALNPKASACPICMLALQSSADKPDELQQLIPFAVNISFTSDFDF